ncbi:MAG: mechanosensitive ion channel domain-containing protein [Acidobacteriota bacterium]
MSDFLSFRLFKIGENSVTVSSIVVFLAILAATWVAARIARKLIAERLLARTHLAIGARYSVGRVLAYLIWFAGVMLAVNALGINASSLAAFGAALGVGLGFGLQDIVKNFFAGIIVLLERPIMVGDRIEIDKMNGDVAEIRTRSTVIRTNDDVFLIVPNSKFMTDTVTNWSFRSNRIRFRVPIGVASDSHPREVEKALIAAASRCDGILPDPPPSVYFLGFGESTLDFELLCWTSQMLHKRPAFVSALNFAIWEELSARRIAIPNPQRDLHIKTAEGLSFLKDGGPPEPAGGKGTGIKPAPSGAGRSTHEP